MSYKKATPFGYRVLFFLGRIIGYNIVIFHDAGVTKYSNRIEIHK